MGDTRAEPRAEEASLTRLAWRRALVLVLPVLYVAGTAVATSEASPRTWMGIAAGLALALVGAVSRPGETAARARARLFSWGALALAASSVALTERAPWVTFARELALLGATLAALRAVATIDGDPGLAAQATDAAAARGPSAALLRRLAASALVVAWGGAALSDALAASGIPQGADERGPIVAAAAGAAALVVLGATSLVVAAARRLELAAPPRALACAAASAVGLLVALALALTTGASPDAAAALGAALGALVVVELAEARDALALARRGRRALSLALFGGPVALLAGVAAEGRMAGGALVAVLIALATLTIGAFARRLEEPLLPARGALLEALADATRAAHDREARAGMVRALMRLREAAGQAAPSPELWILHPTRIYTVDAAGYLQERAAELPPKLLEVAQGEPGGTVRVDVLRALEVRRADLRPLLRWLCDRGALFATLVAEGEEPDGVVLIPAGTRTDPVSIEEVFAAKRFADAFVAVCQAWSARARHLERERALVAQVDALDDELGAARHAQSLAGARNALAATRLARPATVGIYSAAARLAEGALERRIQNDAPVVLTARAGIDPVPYLARAHLRGPRKEGPLVVVDGTSSREHDLPRWRDERTSPLALADGGLLVLVDGAALPREVQVLVARALTERRAPWERPTPLDAAAALTATAPPATLLAEGLLAPELYARFEDAPPIELPGLHDRPEDLFSIVADRLAREGLRVHGRPVGIDAAAFARLVEHPFDGEDHELASIVTRLVAGARGDVIRKADVEALGLPAPRDGGDVGTDARLRGV